jgi:hypothetical protein
MLSVSSLSGLWCDISFKQHGRYLRTLRASPHLVWSFYARESSFLWISLSTSDHGNLSYAVWERKRIVAIFTFAIWLTDNTIYIYGLGLSSSSTESSPHHEASHSNYSRESEWNCLWDKGHGGNQNYLFHLIHLQPPPPFSYAIWCITLETRQSDDWSDERPLAARVHAGKDFPSCDGHVDHTTRLDFGLRD